MISFKGIGQWCATFAGDGLQEGMVVKAGEGGKAVACGEGEAFIGTVLCAEKDVATVQVGGFAEVGYTGTAPAVGYVGLSADGSGGVKSDAGGRKYWVAGKNESAQTVMILL